MHSKINGYELVDEIDTGSSSVKKCLVTKDNELYLLRLYDIRFMSDRYNALNKMMLLEENNVSVPRVYEYGELSDKSYGYAIVDWIEGESLDKLLVDDRLVLEYGKKAADELLKIHNLEKSYDIDVLNNYLNLLNRKIEKVRKLGVDLDYNAIKKFAFDNSIILKNKEVNIIHGDVHPGNIIIDNKKLYFIDLDVCRKDYALVDLSTNACNMDNPNFYTVLISEYFGNDIPDGFWLVYSLYGVLYCLDNILYCNRMSGKTIIDGINSFNCFLKDTDNFNELKPKWFNEKILRKER